MSEVVVLGGGMAGMLAAAVLAEHAERVTIVERDEFPDEPRHRKGLPQGHHSHMFMAGGADALGELLPGILEQLYAAGANRRGMPAGMLTLSSVGWFRRHPGSVYVVVCGRELTDHVLRQRILAEPRIEVRTGAVTGLTGGAERVTGVRLDGGETIETELVVDATGRRSKAPDWLAGLGLPEIEEDSVDSGLAYATRLFEAPPGVSEDFPAVLIQPRAGTGEPGRGATLFPIEHGRWIATLTGTRGGQPPTDADGFLEFARNLPDPVIAELLTVATPLGTVRPYHGTANRRRYLERLPVPEGFLALGDSLVSLNPVYAHGMSAAALEALELRAQLRRGGIRPELAPLAQTAIAEVAETPWRMASAQDLAFPEVRTRGQFPGPDPAEAEFGERMARTALSEPAVANAMFGMFALQRSQAEAMTAEVGELVARGPERPPLTTTQAYEQFAELSGLLEDAPVPVGTANRWGH